MKKHLNLIGIFVIFSSITIGVYLYHIPTVLPAGNQTQSSLSMNSDEVDRRVVEKEFKRKMEIQKQKATSGLKKQIESMYAQAISLYKEKKYYSALLKFQHLDAIMPDYKSTRRYIEKIKKQTESSG